MEAVVTSASRVTSTGLESPLLVPGRELDEQSD